MTNEPETVEEMTECGCGCCTPVTPETKAENPAAHCTCSDAENGCGCHAVAS